MKFKLFGTEIYVSFLFCATLSFMICTDRTGLVIPTLLAVVLHEAGHLFAMYLYECPPISIRLIPASVQITEKLFVPDKKSIKILLAGPLLNIAAGLTAFLNYGIYKAPFALEFSVINFALGLFNLLPVCGLDGGSVLTIILKPRTKRFSAETIIKIITAAIGFFTLAAALYLYFTDNFNLSVLIAALYFFVCCLLKN